MQQPLDLAQDGAIATITLNRPDKHNLLAVADLAPFGALLDRVVAAPEARVLVVTVTGEKTCSAGIDLEEGLAASAEAAYELPKAAE